MGGAPEHGAVRPARVAGGEGVVDVEGGRVRGRSDEDVWTFAGVPYARAPIGTLRWRAPQPPEPWTGVRPVHEPGAIAPQSPAMVGAGIPGDPSQQSEDCLHLTVRTPALDGRRPVMVWIHGGGFTSGTAGSNLYDGSELARRHDVVVVAVNYRLGALGFLAHPALGGSAGSPCANWGLLDQIAAFRWVQEHIGAFGGDPSNVTVFGESAGAMSVCALLAMPAARGLFHKVIVQSGPPYTHTLERGAEAADDVVRALGLREVDRGTLEKVPASAFVEAVAEMQRRRPRPGELPLPLLPTVDGVSLPGDPLAAVRAGSAAHVPMVVGTNRDELAFFALMESQPVAWDEALLVRRLAWSAPEAQAEDVAAVYRSARARRGEAVTPRRVWTAAGTDLVFRWPSLRLASAHRRHAQTFAYLFTWETPFLGGSLGACHALELPFVFGTFRHPVIGAFSGSGPAAETLSEGMQEAWAAFARSGDPSTDRAGAWPPWDGHDRQTMVWGEVSGVENAPFDEELDAWARVMPLDPAERGEREPSGGEEHAGDARRYG